MASLISEYSFDIFISYRHKDNEYEGWVTEFATNLKKELRATLKEDISIYFDDSPDDGMLEMYHVDKSIEDKLRCLIFIPILSQTYCDPKSFAWKYEFCAFNRLVQKDLFGRDIKLKNGNVASRILPVQIHELAADDRKLLEDEIGSAIRSIDFIYKESGVNRPLRAKDDNSAENPGRIKYRNQINKLANAVKEIIEAIMVVSESKEGALYELPSTFSPPIPVKNFSKRNKIRMAIGVVLIITLGAFLIYRFTSQMAVVKIIDRSVAVLPFVNLSSDREQEYFSDGMTDQIITNLTSLAELKVIARTSVMKYKNTVLTIPDIASELHVGYVMEGSVQKVGNRLKITAQLIQAGNNFHVWAETYNRESKDLFAIQDDISMSIAQALGRRFGEAEDQKPKNLEAYDHFLRGNFFSNNPNKENLQSAIKEYNQAVNLDPRFALGYVKLASCYMNLASTWGDSKQREVYAKVNEMIDKSLEINPKQSEALSTKAGVRWWFDRNYPEAESLWNQSGARVRGDLGYGFFLFSQGRADEALPICLSGYSRSPLDIGTNIITGDCHLILGKYKEAKIYYVKALELFPFNPDPYFCLARLHYQMNEYDQMTEILNQGIAKIGEDEIRLMAYLGIAMAKKQKMGKTDDIIKKLEDKYSEKKRDAAYYVASIYAAIGQKEKTLEWLSKSLMEDEGELIWLKVEPVFEPIRNSPEFKAILVAAGYRE